MFCFLAVAEEEKEFGSVSPQFDDYQSETCIIKEMNGTKTNLPNYTVDAPNLRSPGEGEPSTSSSQAAATDDSKINIISKTNCKATSKVPIEENITEYNGTADVDHKHVLSTILLCSLCKQLLFRPVVLNCGDGKYSSLYKSLISVIKEPRFLIFF